MDDIFIHSVPLPGKAYGCIILDGNGDYIVFINSNLSEEVQLKARKHELMHIKSNHTYNQVIDIATCEKEANRK